MELALDTTSVMASLALAQEGRVIAQLCWQSPQSQTAELLPSLEYLLRRLGARPADFTLVSVARGPGGWSGTRVGLSTAKGFAVGLGVPVIGVSTLEAMALPFRETGLSLCPLVAVGRGEVAVALFRQVRGRWKRLVPEQLVTPEGLAALLPRKALLVGEIPPELIERLKRAVGRGAAFAGSCPPRAAAVAALGWQRFQRGETDPVAALQPLYLRPPSITMPRPREVGDAATT